MALKDFLILLESSHLLVTPSSKCMRGGTARSQDNAPRPETTHQGGWLGWRRLYTTHGSPRHGLAHGGQGSGLRFLRREVSTMKGFEEHLVSETEQQRTNNTASYAICCEHDFLKR